MLGRNSAHTHTQNNDWIERMFELVLLRLKSQLEYSVRQTYRWADDDFHNDKYGVFINNYYIKQKQKETTMGMK